MHIAVAEVVGEDDDDVGRGAGGSHLARHADQRQNQEPGGKSEECRSHNGVVFGLFRRLWCSSIILVTTVRHRTFGVPVLDATLPECLMLSTMVNKESNQEPIMRLSILLSLMIAAHITLGFAQASGNIAYSQ